jgi:hypothetical protein
MAVSQVPPIEAAAGCDPSFWTLERAHAGQRGQNDDHDVREDDTTDGSKHTHPIPPAVQRATG